MCRHTAYEWPLEQDGPRRRANLAEDLIKSGYPVGLSIANDELSYLMQIAAAGLGADGSDRRGDLVGLAWEAA